MCNKYYCFIRASAFNLDKYFLTNGKILLFFLVIAQVSSPLCPHVISLPCISSDRCPLPERGLHQKEAYL